MMEPKYIEQIKNSLALSQKEAELYYCLLRLKQSLPGTLSKISGIKRPTTYLILEQLEAKGLVSKFSKANKNYYQPVEPEVAIETQQRKIESMKAIVPLLKQLTFDDSQSSNPKVSFFEGEDGIINVLEDSLSAQTDICCWSNIDLAAKSINDYYLNYVKRRVKRNISIKAIFPYSKHALEFKARSQADLRELYLVPQDQFHFQNEINIYDDKVSIISHEEKIGIIIKSKLIADSQRAIFLMNFQYAKLLEKDLLTEEDYAFMNKHQNRKKKDLR